MAEAGSQEIDATTAAEAPVTAPGSDAVHDADGIFEQMQKLTDIEADLADTALAVAVPSQPIVQPTTEIQNGVGDVGDAAAQITAPQEGQDGQEALLNNATAMENLLEQAIPDDPAAPPPAEAAQDQTFTTEIPTQSAPTAAPAESIAEPSLVNPPAPTAVLADQQILSVPTPTPTPASNTAQEAETLLHAVEADITVPVLPQEAVEPAHDVPLETKVEEDTSEIQIDIEEPTPANVAEAISNGEPAPVPAPTPPSIPLTSNPMSNGAPLALSPLPPQTITSSLPPPVPTLPVQTPVTQQRPKLEVELPEGLTADSPSVLSNPELVKAWSADPSNPNPLLGLFSWAVQKTEIHDARVWYTALAKYEPTAIQPLLALINLELALSNFSQVESLFASALKGPSGGITAAADVSVWKAYLHYIRRQNPISEAAANADTVRGTITKAYEFALKECGTDRESGEIWQEYISFLSDAAPKNTWETQQQMDNLRKVYQRAVCVPLNNVEALWKAYDAFESGLNKQTAKKFLAEKSPAYMTARTALRELRTLTDNLPRPILPPHPTFSENDRQIVSAWKGYLKWEESNPLVIEDKEVLSHRIGYAIRKCLGEMRHFPELWHYAANWFVANGKPEEATAALSAGVEACPSSFLLTFALADAEEEAKNLTKCHEVYTSLIDRLNPEIEKLKATVAAEVDTARGPEITVPTGSDIDMTGDGISEIQKLVEERETRGKLVSERRGRDITDLANAAGVVWVMYMRFARRAEGIKAARGIFGKARKSPHPTWHIFEASAMMEYHANKDSSVAIRIFELGLKLFADDVDYVIKYLQFLLSINDDTNARALFERSAAKIPADKVRPLWDAWARYEYMFADFAGVHKLETRFAEVFPNDSPLKRFAQRFTYNGLDQIALRDLGFGIRHLPPPVSSQPPPAASVLVHPPAIQPPAVGSPSNKRALPESPRRGRNSIERSGSPINKRYRATVSPPPPPRRFPDRDRDPRDRIPSGPPAGRYGRNSRDRSPAPSQSLPPVPPPSMRMPPRGDDRGSAPPPSYGHGAHVPPHHAVPPPPPQQVYPPVHGGYGAPPPPALDRSGLSPGLAWFVGTLPSAKSFDGPIFRPDDILQLFGNIGRDGKGVLPPGPPPPPARAPYPEPDRRYGGPPPRGRY